MIELVFTFQKNYFVMTNQTNDMLDFNPDEDKLPTGLKVLTILTFIGCAYDLYQVISSFLKNNAATLREFDKAQEQIKDAPAWVKNFTGPAMRELLQQSMDNKVPLLIIGLLAVGLCIFGAIEMRKLKKQGYYLWLIGEILPFISVAIFVPAFYQTFLKFFLIVPIIFIILYSVQVKYLKK